MRALNHREVLLANVLQADLYESASPTCDTMAVLFHSSNGARRDLIQLAWELARRGMTAATVTWVAGTPRRAHPEAAQRVSELLRSLTTGEQRRSSVVLVTWCDSTLVVLREANRLAATSSDVASPMSVVSLAGVFGWSHEPPESVRQQPGLVAFFGGPDTPERPWSALTPFATLRSNGGIPVVSVAIDQVLRETLAYHEAARERAVRSRVLHFEGPALELISPRLPAGQAVSDLTIAESALVGKDSIDGHTQLAPAGLADLDHG